MARTQTQEHVICTEGRFWRETRIREEIDPSPGLKKLYSVKEPIKVPSVFMLPNYGPVGMCFNPNEGATYWSIPIPFINLRCEFRAIENQQHGKIMVPKFIYDKTSTEVIQIRWDVRMDGSGYQPRIVLLIQNIIDGGMVWTQQQWLFAFDRRNNVFQLPLANLYEHLQLCCGKYDSHSPTQLECVQKAVEQFENSQWNSDLYDTGIEERTIKFFRFKPKKDGFEVLGIQSEDWTKLCTKRSVTFTEYVV